ncbi:Nitrogen permease regulator 3 [Paramarasmius palmivorus]|uniref:Nitrogen permease regulator 3 n=1 Tax=Paramarasmius palmivorus TaxID=297713 RepID=A0AAW0DHX1_9AGAR
MSETLLAILFVTSSAKGSNLVFRWPPTPTGTSKLTHNAPLAGQGRIPLDDTRRGSSSTNMHSLALNTNSNDNHDAEMSRKDYEEVFGYSSEFLAGILCPHASMCHQKFELVIDDLAFIGHPVCADSDGSWRFKQEKTKVGSRGRESRNRPTSRNDSAPRNDSNPSRSPSKEKGNSAPAKQCDWLHTFHLVMVLDLPDPSSSAAGNVSKYFDVVYEQAAFVVAAVLFQEQVLSNYVEIECDKLSSFKDDCIKKGTSLREFSSQALDSSTLARAMEVLYDAIKASSIAYITLNDLPLEVQLPPYLDLLLHNEDDGDMNAFVAGDDDDYQAWGPEMSFGWRLPPLVPWKSLLMLDNIDDFDPFSDLRGPYVSPDDRNLAEGLLKLLETANVTLSLADLASLLDWELESQVYPIARWLVQHRRAKIVDIVHSGLKTVFTLPSRFDHAVPRLAEDFERDFGAYQLPPLPQILSLISTSSANQSGNHFFASVVQSKELIPIYHEVVVWMLKRDMLTTLHLRIRIVATSELKAHVRLTRAKARSEKNGRQGRRNERDTNRWLNLPPVEDTPLQRVHSVDSSHSELSELVLESDGQDESSTGDYVEGMESSDEREDSGWETAEDESIASIISDPGRATPLQRRWLSAMSVGKDPRIVRRFEFINQYFDGIRTDDEILYRADITRKQLREVLHHYEEYVSDKISSTNLYHSSGKM